MQTKKEIIRNDIVWTNVDLETGQKIVDMASKNDIEFDKYSVRFYTGSLLDEYAIYNSWTDGQKQYAIRPKRTKPRKHILLEENYVNEWSSAYTITFTDNQEKYDKFIEQHDIDELDTEVD